MTASESTAPAERPRHRRRNLAPWLALLLALIAIILLILFWYRPVYVYCGPPPPATPVSQCSTNINDGHDLPGPQGPPGIQGPPASRVRRAFRGHPVPRAPVARRSRRG